MVMAILHTYQCLLRDVVDNITCRQMMELYACKLPHASSRPHGDGYAAMCLRQTESRDLALSPNQ
jgi:hypothetical protein